MLFAYIDPTGGLPPSMWGMLLAWLAAASGMLWAFARRGGYRIWDAVRHTRKQWLWLAAPLLGIAVGGLVYTRTNSNLSSQSKSAVPTKTSSSSARRAIVLALDGLDPILTERWMAEGKLPNLAALAERGHYCQLGTTTPPQSPVAWASFITCSCPAEHGIWDFVHRNPANYGLDLSMVDRRTMARGWQGEPFWQRDPGGLGHLPPVTLIKLPLTFPPPQAPGKVLSGMGAWDARGTEGTYFYFSTTPPEGDFRGMVLPLRGEETDGKRQLHGELPGPYFAGGADRVREPFQLTVSQHDAWQLEIAGQTVSLEPDVWSPWIQLKFGLGLLKLQKVAVATRMLARWVDGEPTLYVSPLSFDPAAPRYPLSHPAEYAPQLAAKLGTFHTRGMPFDTQALNDELLDEEAFLAHCDQIRGEREAMLFHELEQFQEGLLFGYFDETDVVQHLFWRAMDTEHPLYNDPSSLPYRDTIAECYHRYDDLVGRVAADMPADTLLVVLSDHGFAPFRRAVHLNRILAKLGYAEPSEIDDAQDAATPAFDWKQTQAYAVGFNAVYLNLEGRESQGIVSADEAETLKREIAAALEKFVDPATGERPIHKVHVVEEDATRKDPNRPDLIIGYARGYRASWETALGRSSQEVTSENRQKWSGDHCIDGSLVPGVLFASDANFRPAKLEEAGSALQSYLTREHAVQP